MTVVLTGVVYYQWRTANKIMANYATVENGFITGRYDLLPESTESVSGLHLLANDEEMLNSLGWYTVQKVTVSYDAELQYITDYLYHVSDNKVYETPQIASYVLPTAEEKFNATLIEVRAERDKRLALSDWTQLADVQQVHDTLWVTAWASYRQELRDLPNRCISGEINIYAITWPIEP
jgi:hypothetical protein